MGMLIHITIREHILLYNNLYANRIYFIVGIKHAGNNFNMLKKKVTAFPPGNMERTSGFVRRRNLALFL